MIEAPKIQTFKDLIIVADNDTRDMLKPAEMDKIKNRKSFMTFMFALKARTTVSEMFALGAVMKYYQHHKAGLNPKTEYRCWW